MNHMQVLDLMVRMLGFSDEDKQRIGLAQHGAGKGVVRGVLGLPGRLVGGILGGTSADQHSGMASENQVCYISVKNHFILFLLFSLCLSQSSSSSSTSSLTAK